MENFTQESERGRIAVLGDISLKQITPSKASRARLTSAASVAASVTPPRVP